MLLQEEDDKKAEEWITERIREAFFSVGVKVHAKSDDFAFFPQDPNIVGRAVSSFDFLLIAHKLLMVMEAELLLEFSFLSY